MSYLENQLLKVIVASLASLYLLLVLFILLSSYECFSLLALFISLLIVASSYIEFALKQKKCEYLCFFDDKSFIFRFLTSPYLLVIILIVYSLVLSVSIFLEVFTFTLNVWIYLGLHTLVMTLIFYKLKSMLKSSVKQDMLGLFAMGFSAKVGTVIFFIIYILIFYYSDTPNYIQDTLPKTVQLAAKNVNISCLFIEYLLQAKLELNATILWSILYSSQHLENENYKTILWIGYITTSALGSIGINRLIVQIIYLLDKYLGNANDN